MKNIVFIVPILTQPRVVKRIKSIIDCGYICKVYGYFDGTYNSDLKELPFDIDGVLIDPRTSFRIINSVIFRVYPYYAIYKIIKQHEKDSIFYVFDFDMAKVVYRLGCRNYVYEEADINSSKIANKIRRERAIKLDKKIAYNSFLSIYTSEGFVDYLFGAEKVKPNYLVLPNKLSNYFVGHSRDSVRKHFDIARLRFGFIGLIRYPETIFKFASLVADYSPLYEFHFFGSSASKLSIPSTIEKKDNVYFHGKFANPFDLEKIYSSIDINVACYDTQSSKMGVNVRVAEPNKLYESIYFKTPIIVSKDTFVGDKVCRLGVGEAIDASDEASIHNFISSLTVEKLKRYSSNSAHIDAIELIDNPKELSERLSIYVER